ncbi:aldose epimerase family protein [Sulfitobacter noctilucicola]|uniref:Aldose 1-epimerase n=1 Tax=Sulfitobacter noctilucicola TaxID=1342301 RepID=A0A7W6M7N9_9RHOB|nr:aldose epimerase family protein [Sulfitobacter noctilucicola]MBB4173970.1 aldose 1-epimerase [Sulfitobacter noctilucicola]
MSAPASITLTSERLTAEILLSGATLTAVRAGRSQRNLVLGFADPLDHQQVAVYAGAIVGPVANRIEGGRVTIRGKTYQMPRNENGETCLHSGPDGIHARDWMILSQSPTAVALGLTLGDGDQGLPGERHLTAEYALNDDTLTLSITARTDQLTPINIAAHPYWNLDGLADVSGHRLMVTGDRYLPTGPDSLPTGEISQVAQTDFDYRHSVPLQLDPALDVNFCLAAKDRADPQHAATLTGSDGTTLEIATTAPGLQVYSGAFLPERAGILSEGRDLRPYAGVALEPQGWPNAPHQPAFPQITVSPGETWKQVTTYKIKTPD